MSRTGERDGFAIPAWIAACAFVGIAVFFLWEEHEAHILGAIPYVILAACPLIHIFMHRGHGHGGAGRHDAVHGDPGANIRS